MLWIKWKKMIVKDTFSEFLMRYDWNYFITCRTPYKIHTMTVRTWAKNLMQYSKKIDRLFFVSERDKGDYHNLHVHMLLGTNMQMTYREIRKGLGNIPVGDYQAIYDCEYVCAYVSKHIGNNVDYDLFIKS